MTPDAWLLSCEHAGRRIPRRHASHFAGAGRTLAGHRGHDRGALALARRLSRRLGCPLHFQTVSRLLVDLNRSPRHPRVFSEYVRDLPREEKERILARWHRPYREALADAVEARRRRGRRVVHVSVHSFTPVLAGVVRRCEVGILYDPRRAPERRLAVRWQAILRELAPGLRVRRNYPYRGAADGLTSALRRRFGARHYLGLELEVNQRHLGRSPAGPVLDAIEASLVRLRRAGR